MNLARTVAALPKKPQRRRFTVDEYDRLTELGLWGADDRIELIRGDLIEMVAKGTAHILCCRKLLQQLVHAVQTQAIIQCQDPIVLPLGSEPEPDFALLDVNVGDFKPNADQVLLVIEVSDSSLDYDRTTKGPLYAEAQIPHYWIFNCLDKQVECHSQLQQNAKGEWLYSLCQVILPPQRLALPGSMQGAIDIGDCF
ncbi:MAG: Uma2 family endonuclease [Synechococcales cyanobacterium RU_4_20]|nr:Uma2 family endonuclease [Synechococcales cyanobacterium RU_4_20]